MVIVITLQSQFASLAQKCLRRTKLMKLFMCLIHIFIRWPAEETSIGLTNVSLNGDSFFVKSCICPFILSCFWQPYECVTGLSKVFWVVVSHYVCYSVCFSILEKIQKLSFWYFFLGWFLSLWDRCGSFWDRPRSFEDRCGSLWVVVGSLWVVVDRCGSFRVLVTTACGYYEPTWGVPH